MTADVLVDTGALLALLDGDDDWHFRCTSAFCALPLPLLTSEAVLTELFHLVGDDKKAVDAAWRFLRSGAITIGTITDEELPTIQALMARYHDRPMDFADATLVYLARRSSIVNIFTVDNNDFETYRIDARRRFRIVPGRDA